MISTRLRRRGIYILDEPEAALSPTRQLAFLRQLEEIEQAKESQIIIATHSPIILSYRYATVFEIKEGKIIETLFDQTNTFKEYSDFFHRLLSNSKSRR